MQLTMLGTGNAFAKKYFNNNALIQVENYALLVDCGITAPLALDKLGKNPNDLDGILITHLHADHIGGLEEFAYVMKYVYGRKLTLFVPAPLIQPLWEHALKAGLEEHADSTLDSYFHVVPLEEHTLNKISAGLHVEMIRTQHVPNKLSYSLLINDFLFYSSDIIFDLNLLSELFYKRQVQYILHDCQLSGQPTVHATLSQLITAPKDMQKHIYLMHYGDEKESFHDQIGEMQFMEQQKTYIFQSPS